MPETPAAPDPQGRPAPRRGLVILLAVCAVVIVGGAVGVAAIGDVRQGDVAGRVWGFVALFGAQFVAFLAALVAVRGLVRRGGDGRGALALVLVAAIGARIVLLAFSWPNLSDDLHRYVWEGMAQHHGVNPYLTKPKDAPPAVRDSPEGRDVTHPDVSAIYPPVTELFFRLIHPVARTPRGYRAALLVFDLATLAVLALLLKSMQRSVLWVIVYAWHPLIITEFAGSGHFDSLGIFWMVLAMYLLRRRKGLWAYAALGASIAAKYVTGPLVFFFWPRTRRWHALAMVAVMVLLFWPYVPGGYAGLMEDGVALIRGEAPRHAAWRIFGGMRTFVTSYHSNAGLHRAVLWITGEEMWHDPVTRVVMGLLLVGLIVGMWRRRAHLATAGLFTLGGIVVLGRVVHPWYACWIVPWLVLKIADDKTPFTWFTGAWLLFTGTVATSYTVLIGYVRTMHDPQPQWMVPTWSMGLQYVPLVVLLAAGAVQLALTARRSGRGVHP